MSTTLSNTSQKKYEAQGMCRDYSKKRSKGSPSPSERFKLFQVKTFQGQPPSRNSSNLKERAQSPDLQTAYSKILDQQCKVSSKLNQTLFCKDRSR